MDRDDRVRYPEERYYNGLTLLEQPLQNVIRNDLDKKSLSCTYG